MMAAVITGMMYLIEFRGLLPWRVVCSIMSFSSLFDAVLMEIFYFAHENYVRDLDFAIHRFVARTMYCNMIMDVLSLCMIIVNGVRDATGVLVVVLTVCIPLTKVTVLVIFLRKIYRPHPGKGTGTVYTQTNFILCEA